MFRKMVMAVPIVGAFALCVAGAAPSAQSAPVSTAFDSAPNPLIQLVRDRGGGGGMIFRGGGGGGGFRGGWSGGGRSFGGGGGGGRFMGGGGRSFSGGGGGFKSYRSFGSGGSPRFVGRPNFRGYNSGFGKFSGGSPRYIRRPGDIGPRRYTLGRTPPSYIDGGSSRRDWRRGKFAHWKHRHHRRYYPYWAYGGLGIYTSGLYGYYDDCAYLRERALATSSVYWWRRYQACEAGYTDY